MHHLLHYALAFIPSVFQGHTVGAAMTGGMSGGSSPEEQQPAEPAYPQQPGYSKQDQYNQNPCNYELQQFLNCSQSQSDITLCMGFNEALKQCKLYHGKYKKNVCCRTFFYSNSCLMVENINILCEIIILNFRVHDNEIANGIELVGR
jgi:hypothetical protein